MGLGRSKRKQGSSLARRTKPSDLSEHGAPSIGVRAVLETGSPPTDGVGRYSTGNAALRVNCSKNTPER